MADQLKHWHGLTQRTAPFSDGTPLVSQWPIPPGRFFDYEIRPHVGDAGTYFYHSHVGFQQVSAYGALIVKDRHHKAYHYDEDVTITLGNYFAQNDSVVVSGLLGSPFQWTGEAKAITVQGQSGTASFGGQDSSCIPHVIEIEPGQKIRLRVIGACALTTVKMGIESHQNLTVIEADGQYTEATEVDHIQVAPGQRFSYIFEGKTSDELETLGKTEFWIRYESRDRPTVTSGYALLRYKNEDDSDDSGNSEDSDGSTDVDDSNGSDDSANVNAGDSQDLALPSQSPVQLPQLTYDYLEYALQPLSEKSKARFPRVWEVTRTIYLQMQQVASFGVTTTGAFNGSVSWVGNGHSWEDGGPVSGWRTPYLVDMYLNGKSPDFYSAIANDGFDTSTQTFPARIGEVLDIVWLNNGGIHGTYDSHPMHMHGEHYWDLGSGNGTYNPWENDKKFRGFTPAKRDTTSLYRYGTAGVPYTTAGWRAWRTRVTEENIGAWMAHCHVAQHAVMGMNTVWIFGMAKDMQSKFPALPFVSGYLQYGGNAYGSDDEVPIVQHFFPDDE
ncbi:hypothetical protein ANO11243_003510 [Dothideomycetidae sp. 11243]|nr:hypothetical protein ANO11243_003510 [fungal sp. No.11243]